MFASRSVSITVFYPSRAIDLADRQAFEAFQAQSRFGSLDGLRCVAILMVLWHHSPLMPLLGSEILLASRGFVGVDFFFVLSGFLITTLLLREEERAGRLSLLGFYGRRALRILPVYFLVVALAALLFIGVKGQQDLLAILPYYPLFLANFLPEHIPLLDPTWSLSVEEQFYALWPLVLLLMPRRWLLQGVFVLVTLNVLGGAGLLAPFGVRAFALGDLWIALPNATYAPLLLGAAIALLLHQPGGFSFLWRLAGGRGAALFYFGLVLLALLVLPRDLLGWPNLALHLLMGVSLVSLVVREDNSLATVLGWRPVARVGQVSYGLYLYHLLGLHVATKALTMLGHSNPWSVLLLYCIVSYGIAEVSFRLYETPFQRLRPKTSQVKQKSQG